MVKARVPKELAADEVQRTTEAATSHSPPKVNP